MREAAVSGEIERLSGWADNSAVLSAIHQLETRVVVLETRAGAQDDRLLTIENDLRDTKTGVQRVLQCLQDHTVIEEKDRVKLLTWIIATLLSVIGFGVAAIWEYLSK